MEPLSPKDPKSIGDYTLIGRLGSGGMGIVYLAANGPDSVALKVIRESLLEDPSQATRFSREIETLKKISSPYVAKIINSGVTDGQAWYATEFVNGPDLKSLVEAKGPLKGDVWMSLAKGLLQGISAIHAQGIIHRDIKPANVIIAESGPKIIDFGIAQVADATSVTSTGAIAGTPAWFSPEQIEGSEISKATDLFSAGSTLVYAAKGKTPWGDVDSTTKASVYKILLDEPDLSGLSEKQSRLVMPLLNKDPSGRSRDGKPPVEANQEVPILSGESWFQRLEQSSRPRKLALSLAIILMATTSGLVLNSFTWPNAEDSRGDSPEQLESAEDTAEPLPAVPLGPDFFEDIATGIELTSAQYGERITFTLGGPGASYVRAAEVSLSDLPEEWLGDCASPVTLERVPVGVAFWAESCELSLPSSGETVPGSAAGQLAFIDNDGANYFRSLQANLEVQAFPKPPPQPVFLRLQQADSDPSYRTWEAWWAVRGGSVIHRLCSGQVAWDFRRNNPEVYQVLGISGEWVNVSSGRPSSATAGCTNFTGWQSPPEEDYYGWTNSIDGAQIKQLAGGRECVVLRLIELGWNQEMPPYQYTESIEVCFS